MPATEKTWYDQKLLHLIFGLSSVVMLISTIWMIADDHVREWKGYQREFRSIQQKQLNGRLRAEQKNQVEVIKQAQIQLAAAQSELPPVDLIEEFKTVAKTVASESKIDQFNFDRVDGATEKLEVQTGVASERLTDFEAAQVGLREARAAVATAADDTARGEARAKLQEAQADLAASETTLTESQQDAGRLRTRIFRELNKVEAEAKYQMSEAVNDKKFATAHFSERTAKQGLLYPKGQFGAASAMQAEIDGLQEKLVDTLAQQERTTANRNELRSLITKMTAKEQTAAKNLEDAYAEANRLTKAIDQLNVKYFSWKTVAGKKLLELPVVDGFNGPLTIDNLWTDNLTMPNGSFGKVKRFDRCTTCHRGIGDSAPGSATLPAYEKRHEVVTQISVPATEPAAGKTLEDVYGIVLADKGLLDRNDVTIEYVVDNSLAATAVNVSDSASAGGLMESDIIRYIGGDKVDTPRDAVRFLMSPVDDWGSVLEVVVERGMPQPYTSHPRLDLYVGALSPHKMSIIGCTVCHEGEGSGTSFNYTSHTPNSIEQEDAWRKKHGWFNNHHWIYPMNPARFAESSCLKCHHEVVELGPSERFPDPPAPKLLAGHNLIQAYGCFGCHEINGYKSKTERIGPDLRLEPNYFAAAAQLSHDESFKQLPVEDQAFAHHLVQHPEDVQVRHRLLAAVERDATSETPKLSAAAQKLTEVLADINTPGKLRKVGPSLRHASNKLGPTFLYAWIREPKNFRPSTKMPQFFGMWNHIRDDAVSLAKAQAYEPVEIMGIVTYLLDKSQPMQYVEPAEGVSAADAERGKIAFETRGCLACHKHSAFDDASHGEITAAPRPGVSRQIQGPNLSNLGDKLSLAGPNAKKWLYTWLRNPHLYHPRTLMPDLFLTPIKATDGTMTDPAADIAAFLRASSNGWKPTDVKLNPEPEVVEKVALEHLKKAFFEEDAKNYVQNGISEELGKTLKGSEVELVNVGGSKGEMNKKLLTYIGAKTIGKYGCYGCHDIPGFEGVKPIGTALADWGRKETSKIAFEHIAEYISHGHHVGSHVNDGHGETHDGQGDDLGEAEEHIDEHFYTHRLKHHDRTGFIWQKLKEPRSYDYKKTLNKDYNDKLRMPMFPFTDEQREQVITFILGLISEPPAKQFVFQPDDRKQALIEGQKVLDKYNCAGCHVLKTEKWEIEYRPGEFEAPLADVTAFPFTSAKLSPNLLSATSTPHKQRGSLSGVVEGMPTITHPGRDDNAQPVLLEFDSFDEEWYPVELGAKYDENAVKRSLTLWKPAAIEAHTMEVGQVLEIAQSAIRKRHLAYGGDLALRLLPRVLEIERETNIAAKGGQAWGWLPPSLHREGTKVQPKWLRDFLLEPHPIRPATFMRMPRFNMSPAEATALVNYFVARDNPTYPYEYVNRKGTKKLDQLEAEYIEKVGLNRASGIERMHAGMNIVTFKDYCVTCHLVGDYEPAGAQRAKSPNLANVFKRLRVDFVRNWIAKPSRILPYTPMPVVIPYTGQPEQLVPQTLYHGTPEEQLDGVVDLLMNYDRYTAGRATIKDMVKIDTTTADKL